MVWYHVSRIRYGKERYDPEVDQGRPDSCKLHVQYSSVSKIRTSEYSWSRIEKIEGVGQKAIIALMGNKDLHSLCSSVPTKNVISSKAFVKPYKLPPTSCAMKYHSPGPTFRWMRNEIMRKKSIPITDWVGALWTQRTSCYIWWQWPQHLMKTINCQCTTACHILQCSCKTYEMAYKFKWQWVI